MGINSLLLQYSISFLLFTYLIVPSLVNNYYFKEIFQNILFHKQ